MLCPGGPCSTGVAQKCLAVGAQKEGDAKSTSLFGVSLERTRLVVLNVLARYSGSWL